MELKRAALIMAASVVATYAVCSFLRREPAKPAVGTKPSPTPPPSATPPTERRLDADWDGPEHLLFAVVRGKTLILVRKELKSGVERVLWEGTEPEREPAERWESLSTTPWGVLLLGDMSTVVLYSRGADGTLKPTRLEYDECMGDLTTIRWLARDRMVATYFGGEGAGGEDCTQSLWGAGGLQLWRKQRDGSWQVVWSKPLGALAERSPGPAAFCRCPDGIYLAHFDEIVEFTGDEEEEVHEESLWWWRLGGVKLHLVGKTRVPPKFRSATLLAIDCERAYFEATLADGHKEVPVLASLSRTAGRCEVHARIMPPQSGDLLMYKIKISPDFRKMLILLYSRKNRTDLDWNLQNYLVTMFSFSGEAPGRVIDVLHGQVH